MRRRALVIVNPVAGKRSSPENLKRLKERLDEAGVEFELRETSGEGDAARWAREAVDVDMVIALGGDGTTMEAMSGLIEGQRDIPLAQVPVGTANLVARALGIPTDLEGALEVALAGVAVRHDVGRVEGSGRYFALVAGAGFDAQLIEDTPRRLKNRLGFTAYLLAGVRNLFRLRRSNILLQIDGHHHHFRAHTVMVINVGDIEGMELRGTRDIDPHDGKLDVLIVTPASLLGIVQVAWRILTGNLSGHQDVRMLQAESVKIEANPPLHVQIDGEPIGTTPLAVRAVPSGALFIVPAGYIESRGLSVEGAVKRADAGTSAGAATSAGTSAVISANSTADTASETSTESAGD
ncbi:MAG: diacylglycerol kinase family protein [Trueperaceae bacterium]